MPAINPTKEAMSVVMVQFSPAPATDSEGVKRNINKIGEYVDRATNGFPNVDLIVFPEYSTHGFAFDPYAKHIKFVMSKPYTKWYIIYYQKEKVGSIYLTKQDEIGIHFKEPLRPTLQPKNTLYLQVLKMIMKKNPRNRYLVNINPRNTWMKNFLKNAGFELIQHTYEISKKISV